MTDPRTTTRVQAMTIACPDGWHDKSMLIVAAAAPGASGIAPNMVVTREACPDDLPADPVAGLAAFVDRQLAQMRTSLPGFAEVARHYDERGGSATAELRIDWTADDVPITQWINFVRTADAVLIATATAGRHDFAEVEPAFVAMLQSYRIDTSGASGP